jgi:type II secretory pathway pseudopilin PulG
MKTVAALLTAALLVSGSSATMAAATQDGAAAIQEALQAYLTDTPGVVAVTPSGDQYAITLDLAPLFAKLPGKDVSISVSPLKFTAADNGGGKWKVDQDQAIGGNRRRLDAPAADQGQRHF